MLSFKNTYCVIAGGKITNSVLHCNETNSLEGRGSEIMKQPWKLLKRNQLLGVPKRIGKCIWGSVITLWEVLSGYGTWRISTQVSKILIRDRCQKKRSIMSKYWTWLSLPVRNLAGDSLSNFKLFDRKPTSCAVFDRPVERDPILAIKHYREKGIDLDNNCCWGWILNVMKGVE